MGKGILGVDEYRYNVSFGVWRNIRDPRLNGNKQWVGEENGVVH